MKLKPHATILFSTIFVLIGIVVTMAYGLWQTESDKIPKRLENAASLAPDQQSQYDPEDIRGSYTFGEVSDLYGIPLSELAAAFQIKEAEAASFQVKSLEKQFPNAQVKIGTGSVRMFAAYYLGIHYDLAEETYLPDTACAILENAGHMTAEQRAYVNEHAVALNP